MNFDRYDQAELLAWIEGDLDPEAARALEARLAADPAVANVLRSMRADRAALRATADPALPVDFMADLESQLARPMLMADERPGAYRRRHTAARRRGRRVRYAAAAVVLAALGAGAWWGGSALLRASSEFRDTLARNEESPERAPDLVTPRDAVPWPQEDVIVHHDWRPGAAPRAAIASNDPRPLRAAPTAPVAPTFTLVLAASADTGATERAIADAVASLDGHDVPATLVRNFDRAEASALLARLQRERARRAPSEPRMADTDGNAGDVERAPKISAEELMRRLGIDPEMPIEGTASAKLFGPDALAPSFEAQLELSSDGATHALTIRAALLPALVERLHANAALTPRLAPTATLNDDATPALERWVADLAAVRADLARILERDPDAFVVIPIRVVGDRGD